METDSSFSGGSEVKSKPVFQTWRSWSSAAVSLGLDRLDDRSLGLRRVRDPERLHPRRSGRAGPEHGHVVLPVGERLAVRRAVIEWLSSLIVRGRLDQVQARSEEA